MQTLKEKKNGDQQQTGPSTTKIPSPIMDKFYKWTNFFVKVPILDVWKGKKYQTKDVKIWKAEQRKNFRMGIRKPKNKNN